MQCIDSSPSVHEEVTHLCIVTSRLVVLRWLLKGTDRFIEFFLFKEKVDMIVVVASFSFDDVVRTEDEKALLVGEIFYQTRMRDLSIELISDLTNLELKG